VRVRVDRKLVKSYFGIELSRCTWIAMFDDVLLAQSTVDRFKNSAYDFVIEGESYRARLTPTSTLRTLHPPRRR
jgi:hypothetical protein